MAATPSTFWNSISLRTKITGVTVLMLTFGLIVTGIGTMTVLRSYMLNQLDSQLKAAYIDLSPFLGPGATQQTFKFDDVESAPQEYFVGLLGPDGTLTASNWGSQPVADEPNIKNLETTPSDETMAQQPIYVLSAAGPKPEWHAVVQTIKFQDGSLGTIVIAASLERTDNVTTTYLSIFLAFGIGVVVLGAMLTRLLVTSTFTPLRAVERTAAEIANGDFSRRMSNDTPNTEVGRLNRSLNTMLSRIDNAFSDRAKTIDQMRRFVGDASHELRTPLVSVRGYAELYRMGALQTPDEVAKAMERIEREAIRMGALVEDLLELARLDETRPMNLARIDLVPIAADAAMDARAASPERVVSIILPRSAQPVTFAPASEAGVPASTLRDQVPVLTGDKAGGVGGGGSGGSGGSGGFGGSGSGSNLTGPISFAGATIARLRGRRSRIVGGETLIEIPATEAALATFDSDDREGLAPFVMADENKIRQVVANLIGNALRFTPNDSPIEVAVRVDEMGHAAILDVIDHGEGIPPQIREKIFQRFWRADSSRTRETGGSGLGLAIVSSIVAAHNGTVQAIETPGGGATFRVALPLAPPADAAAAATTAPAPSASAQ